MNASKLGECKHHEWKMQDRNMSQEWVLVKAGDENELRPS